MRRSDAAVAPPSINAAATKSDGLGCHAGAAELKAAAGAAGKSDILDRYAADYPKGPHDQPQSMCPAFGSLRVGLRMRRTATILSGSACCVYGLTFTSHFYGARRTRRLRAVQFRDAGHRQAVRGHPRSRVQARRSCALRHHHHHQSLRADRVGRAAAICCRTRSTACASSASTCRASACRPMPRPRTCWRRRCSNMRARKSSRARCRRRAAARSERPTVTLVGEMFPADPVGIGMMLEPLGLAAGPVVPTREWRELYAALDCSVVAAIHPFYTASFRAVRARRPQDRRLRAGRP